MTIVATGLAHHWALTDGAGSTLTDAVGTGDLTLAGPVGSFWANQAQDATPLGTFAGTTDHIASATAANPSTTAFTVGLAVRADVDAYAGTFRALISHRDPSTSDNGWAVTMDASGIRFIVWSGAGSNIVSHAITRCWSYWLVIQARYDAGTMTLRINNKTVTGSGTIAVDPDSQVRLGGDTGGQAKFRAADVVYYPSTALSDADLTENYTTLLDRVNGSVDLTTDARTLFSTATATPWDGSSTESFAQLSATPITTVGTNTFVADVLSGGATVNGAIAKLDASLAVVQQDDAFTTGHDVDLGHTGPSVGVDENGQVHYTIGRHNETWQVYRTTTAGDLTTVTTDTDPTGGEGITYQGFYRNPSTGELYTTVRTTTNRRIRLYKWTAGSSSWVQIGSSLAETAGFGGYEPTLAFSADGAAMWLFMEWHDPDTGSPRQLGTLAKTTDGGTAWAQADGTAITLPITTTNATTVFPSTRTSTDHHDLLATKMWVDSTGAPHCIGQWHNDLEGDSYGSVWYARWSSTGGYFTHHRLLAHPAGTGTGYPDAIGEIAGTAVVIAPGSAATATAVEPLYALTTTDHQTWTRTRITDSATNWQRISVDREAARAGTVRFRPYSDTTPTISQVWDVELDRTTPQGGTLAPTLTVVGGTLTVAGAEPTPPPSFTSPWAAEYPAPTHAAWADDPAWAHPADGGAVSDWRNEAGTNNFIQTTTTNQPIYRAATAAYNNHATVEMVSADHVYRTIAVAQPFKVLIVANINAADQRMLGLVSSNSSIGLGTSGAGAWAMIGLSSGTIVGGTRDSSPHVFRANYTSSSSQFWVDGTSIGTAALGTGSADILSLGIAGNRNNSTGRPMSGHIAYFGVYPGSVSDADLAALEVDLKTYYGIP